MNFHKEIIGHIEVHSIEGIKECFQNGVSPNDLFRGEPLINELTSEYLRGPSFKECVKVFVDFGLDFQDKPLLAVLLDDTEMLLKHLEQDATLISKRYTLRCTYTPLEEVSLLHICAEFNHIHCAKLLVSFGASINDIAGVDENGFGGQTPIFHTVNQNHNQSADMMNYLLEQGADLEHTVKGLIWGKSYEWETFIPSVNPISYARMGTLPQMHRSEKTIAIVISKLLKYAYGLDYDLPNIPNKYLLT